MTPDFSMEEILNGPFSEGWNGKPSYSMQGKGRAIA
jgi:hypothetical protein